MIFLEEWHAIQVLKRLGHGKKAIARQLGISRNTVKRHWHCNSPPAYQRARSEKILDPFAAQTKEMVGKKFIGSRIFQELTKLGYTGSLTSVYRYLRQFQDDLRDRTTIHFETFAGQQWIGLQLFWKSDRVT